MTHDQPPDFLDNSVRRGLILDPAEAKQRQGLKRYRLNVIQIPALRIFGVFLLLILVALNNYYLDIFSWPTLLRFTTLMTVYALASWGILYLFYTKCKKLDLGFFFLTSDIVFLALAIYYSGGERSLLFFLMMIRVADMANTSFKRVIFFSHVSLFVYIGLLLYLVGLEQRELNWSMEIFKCCCIYFANLYISMTAKTAEKLRNLTRESLALARDLIDQSRKRTEELREAMVRAEAASIAKNQFLANMSHEIRTPLNGIVGMTDLMLDSPLNREQKEDLEIIRQSAFSLSALLTDLLELANLESEAAAPDETAFQLKEILSQAAAPYRPKIVEKGLVFSYFVNPEIPATLMGSPNRLNLILTKLIDNAVKFTKKGEITLRVETNGETDAGMLLHFKLTDTGIGIPVSKHELIFQPFAQIDASSTRKYGGSGVGLALSERLASMMGGQVWLESEAGKGSTFHFTARFKPHSQ